MKKGMAAVLLGAVCVLAASCSPTAVQREPVAGETPAEGVPLTGTQTVENERYSLSFDAQSCRFSVADKSSGFVWHDCPPGAQEDESLKGVLKMELLSHLKINYANSADKTQFTTTRAGSVNKGAFAVEQLPDGFRVVYTFPDEGFVIPVEYTLQNDGFTARVILSNLEETKDNKLISLVLLPGFGAGTTEEEGYMMVPDGSGSIIRLNNGKSTTAYTNTVYGRDRFLTQSFSPGNTQNIYMPVFGMKRGGQAFLAIIEEGDFSASLSASVSGEACPYNLISSEFTCRGSETLSLQVQTLQQETRLINLLASDAYRIDSIRVSYKFLQGNDSDYSGMARLYRAYLEQKGILSPGGDAYKSINLEMLGTVTRPKSLLGIPYNGQVTLTSLRDAADMTGQLTDAGVENPHIVYRNWLAGGQENKVTTSFQFSSKAGKNSEYALLNDKAGGHVYLAASPLSFSSGGNGFDNGKSIRNILNSIVPQVRYNLAGLDARKNSKPRYFLSPWYLEQSFAGLFSAAQKAGVKNIALIDVGDTLYSDFNKETKQDRGDCRQAIEEALRQGGDDVNLLTFGANTYILPYVSAIAATPTGSSQFSVFDQSVPFFQLVLHGYKDLLSSPVNLQGNYRSSLLKALEYGCTPTFTCIAQDPSLLKDTEYDEYYSTSWSQWKTDIVDIAVRVERELAAIMNGPMVSHEPLMEGVYKTVYEHGSVIVNHTEVSVTVDDHEVKPLNFLALGA